MKIKNLKCYALGAILIANSSFMLSCDGISKGYEKLINRDFYNFLDNNDIVSIDEMDNITENYYEAIVSDHNNIGDDIIISDHYERLERIDNVICQGREFDYDYKVLKIEGNSEEGYDVSSMIIENIYDRPDGYDYVYKDDYAIEDGYRDVLINYGEVIRR